MRGPWVGGSLWVVGLTVGLGRSAFGADVHVIYTNIEGHPTAQVPGVPGEEFRPSLTPFLTLYGSPDGTHWIFKAFTDNPDSAANDVIVAGSGHAGTVVAREGEPSPIGGLTYGFMDADCGINDSGQFVFGNRLSGGATTEDEILFVSTGTINSAVREGDAAPGLFDPLGAGNELFGNSLNSAHVLNDGTVAFKADLIQNVESDYESALYQGSSLKVQEGTSAKTLAGSPIFDSFVGLSGNTFAGSADGSAWIVTADIEAGPTTLQAVIVSGTIHLRRGDTLPGLGSPVDSIASVDMAGNGDWFAIGKLLDNSHWAVRNGVVIGSSTAPPAGAPESVDPEVYLDANGNTAGDYYLIVSDNDPPHQWIVLGSTVTVAETGDAVDLDGNGLNDDDAFIQSFTAHDTFLTDDPTDDSVDDREVYTFATLENGAEETLGHALLVVSVGAATCPWDLDGDGSIGVTDLLALLGAWGTDPGDRPDFDDDGVVGVTDLLKLLGMWGGCDPP